MPLGGGQWSGRLVVTELDPPGTLGVPTLPFQGREFFIRDFSFSGGNAPPADYCCFADFGSLREWF
jgi:hypothetical protein